MRSILIIFAIISLASLSYANHIDDAKSFATGFFKVIKGNDWTWNDGCLNDETLQKVHELQEAIKSQDFLKVLSLAQQIYADQKDKCPYSETVQILKDFDLEIHDGKIMTNIIKNARSLIELISQEENHPPTTPTEVGDAAGKFVNIIIYSKTESKSLRTMNWDFSEDDINDLLTGFLEGLCDVPLSNSKCVKSLANFHDEIVKVVNMLIEAIKTRSHIQEALIEMYKLALSLINTDSSCHIKELLIDLASLETYGGLAKLLYRATTNISKLLTDVRAIATDLNKSDFEGTGKAAGDIFSVLLNFRIQ